MEITDEVCSPALDAAIRATADALLAGGACERIDPDALAAARLAAVLTEDRDVTVAVLLHECVPESRRSTPGIEAAMGAAACGLAAELSRLGDFGQGAAWDQPGSLEGSQAETLRRMLLAVVSDPRLMIARLALQRVRLRAVKNAPAVQRVALAAATRAVYAPLANRLGIWRLKWELEDLAFRYLEPDAYRSIAAALNERRADRELYIAEFCSTVQRALDSAGVPATVHGRAKHIYSIYRKMQRKGLAFSQLYDVRAVRILCGSIRDCYAALGVVHGLHSYLPGEFDDYIATPKDNFYRSIHSAVLGPLDQPVEVQIRTTEMHEHAELGVASHWRYKEGRPQDSGDDRKVQWLRRLLDAGHSATDADPDFIERARNELFGQRVYALTPKGQVIELPRGATPLDFAYQVHTGLGHRCRGAKVNGRIVPLTHALSNGDVVEILAAKQAQPSRDWLVADLGFLASPRSRAKLRSWFRQAGATENEQAGRAILERELARLGAGVELVSALVTDLKAQDATQLHRWLGEGEVGATQLSQAIGRRLEATARADAVSPVTGTRGAAGRRSSKAIGSGPVDIEGVGGLPVTLARCCAPVRPQLITGYITVGRGVTVHRAHCRSLLRMQALHPDKALSVTWRDSSSALMPVELTILAYDRHGLVRDLSDVVANEALGIESLITSTNRSEGTARTAVRIAVRDVEQLARILRGLARVGSVYSARRTG